MCGGTHVRCADGAGGLQALPSLHQPDVSRLLLANPGEQYDLPWCRAGPQSHGPEFLYAPRLPLSLPRQRHAPQPADHLLPQGPPVVFSAPRRLASKEAPSTAPARVTPAISAVCPALGPGRLKAAALLSGVAGLVLLLVLLVFVASADARRPRRLISLLGRVGKLHFGFSTEGDVIRAIGAPQHTARGSFHLRAYTPEYRALGYQCGRAAPYRRRLTYYGHHGPYSLGPAYIECEELLQSSVWRVTQAPPISRHGMACSRVILRGAASYPTSST